MCTNVDIALVTVETFIMWGDIFIFLVDTGPFHALYYQPSCQNYFHIAIIVKFAAFKVLLQH